MMQFAGLVLRKPTQHTGTIHMFSIDSQTHIIQFFGRSYVTEDGISRVVEMLPIHVTQCQVSKYPNPSLQQIHAFERGYRYHQKSKGFPASAYLLFIAPVTSCYAENQNYSVLKFNDLYTLALPQFLDKHVWQSFAYAVLLPFILLPFGYGRGCIEGILDITSQHHVNTEEEITHLVTFH